MTLWMTTLPRPSAAQAQAQASIWDSDSDACQWRVSEFLGPARAGRLSLRGQQQARARDSDSEFASFKFVAPGRGFWTPPLEETRFSKKPQATSDMGWIL